MVNVSLVRSLIITKKDGWIFFCFLFSILSYPIPISIFYHVFYLTGIRKHFHGMDGLPLSPMIQKTLSPTGGTYRENLRSM